MAAVFTLETDDPSSKSVKIDGWTDRDKVKRIVHQNWNPFHSNYLSGANYSTDDPSQTESTSSMKAANVVLWQQNCPMRLLEQHPHGEIDK